MTPAERTRIAALEARLARAEAALRSVGGGGVSTRSGPVEVRTTQLGFEAELTGYFGTSGSRSGPADAGIGYTWKRLRLAPGAGPFAAPGVQASGDKAYSFANDTSLAPGTIGWMEPSPDAVGYVFIHGDQAAGSGPGAGGSTPARCSGTVSSEVVYRYGAVAGSLVMYSKLRTLAYNAAGCLTVTYGPESSEVIGCVGCPGDGGSESGGGPPPPPPPNPAPEFCSLCSGNVAGTLYLTASNKTGDCATCDPYGASVPLYQTATIPPDAYPYWVSATVGAPCGSNPPGDDQDYIALQCAPGGWTLARTVCAGATVVLVSASCSPFELVFDVTYPPADYPPGSQYPGCCGAGGGTVRYTITD